MDIGRDLEKKGVRSRLIGQYPKTHRYQVQGTEKSGSQALPLWLYPWRSLQGRYRSTGTLADLTPIVSRLEARRNHVTHREPHLDTL